MSSTLYGGIEAGGTKIVCLVGSGPDTVVALERFPTTTPEETIARMLGFFRAQRDVGYEPAAIGFASFGPVELRNGHPEYGFITTTPKPYWSNTDVAGPIASGLGLPVAFDTDVNGAALGEGRWGAAAGLSTFVYITVGTGIGAGAVVNGAVAHGLVHAEMGHVIVDREPGDDYPGRCPFHADCFEGMAAGPAIEARFGVRAENLEGADLTQAVEWEAGYLASGIRNMVYILAPERVVIGGGVAELPGLFPLLRRKLTASLGGYPGLKEHESDDFVVPAALGGMAGPLGSLVLAEQAVAANG
jgi:fructokinase